MWELTEHFLEKHVLVTLQARNPGGLPDRPRDPHQTKA